MSARRFRAQSRADDDRGFTIIEALVSFVLLSVVGASATTALVQGNTVAKGSSDRVNAANLAQQDLQAARAVDYPNYPAALTKSQTVGSTTYTITRTVTSACPSTPDPDGNPYMQVHTTVSWQPTAPQDIVTMGTEIAC